MSSKQKMKFHNPIISGFYPDPSICRVGDDYYLVNSSFEYFPAIPVWHSRDLVHWELISHAIDRVEQGLKLDAVSPSGGVQAPTIRYHQGVFYITSTCVGKAWPRLDYHFIVFATDPHGPWSAVHYIQNAPGIDCSLFFDEDGQCYFLANREKLLAKQGGDTEIWISRFDVTTFQLMGEQIALWDGTGGNFPEGPHLYKRHGGYYLLIAEGGTCHFHTVTMARSQNIFGPYVPYERNPVLTHKHLHRTYPIQNVGHADLVETPSHEWYMVCLGSRPRGGFYDGGNTIYSFGGYYRNLGRETFLVPMVWEDDMGPLASPKTGKVERVYPFPPLSPHPYPTPLARDDFDSLILNPAFLTIRNAKRDFYQLGIRPSHLRLLMGKGQLFRDECVSFLAKRQPDWHFHAEVSFEIREFSVGDEFGITAFYQYNDHIRLAYQREKLHQQLVLIVRKHGIDRVVFRQILDATKIQLRLVGANQSYRFSYRIVDEWIPCGRGVNGRHLNSDSADGHTGVLIGMYASSLFGKNDHFVDIDSFELSDIQVKKSQKQKEN